MALKPGESTEVADIKRPVRYASREREYEAFKYASLTNQRRAELHAEADANDLSGMTPQERIKWMSENKGKAFSISVKTTVGKANENNTSEAVVPGQDGNQLSEEDKKKLAEEKAARDLKKRKALAALEGARPVRSAIPGIPYGEGDTDFDFMSMDQAAVDVFAEGLSDEDIDRLAAEYDELTWYESAGLAVTDTVNYCTDKIGEGYDYATKKLEEAEGYLDDGINWLKENVLENEYVKKFTDAFTDGFCSLQPFPACLSCPHRKQLLSTEGLDLFRLFADINGWLRKGIFDKAKSLIDCPGLAGALANGDFGSLKETVMTKGMDALVLTGIRCGSAAIFGALGNCLNSPEGNAFALKAESFVRKYSGAAMKSVRSGHLDLISGTMKLADFKADSLFRISTKNTNYQFVNTTVSSSSYKKAYAKKYGLRSYTQVTADTLPSTTKASVKALENAVAKSADDAKATLDSATAEMTKDIEATKIKLSAIEAETRRLVDETGSSEEELVNAGLVENKEVIEEQLADKLKARAASLDPSASLLSEPSVVESVGDKETLSSSGIRTRGSSISANRMSEVYGCTSSLHSLKLAYGADHRVTGRRLPSDIRFHNRSRRRDGVIIKTKSDLLFT